MTSKWTSCPGDVFYFKDEIGMTSKWTSCPGDVFYFKDEEYKVVGLKIGMASNLV